MQPEPARSIVTPNTRTEPVQQRDGLKNIKKWLKSETKPPRLRVNGRYKEYPAGKEGWKEYWKDKREEEQRNSR